MVFGINSASNAGGKTVVVLGETYGGRFQAFDEEHNVWVFKNIH